MACGRQLRTGDPPGCQTADYDIIGIALAASGMEPARIVGGLIEGWGGEEQAGVIGREVSGRERRPYERYPGALPRLR